MPTYRLSHCVDICKLMYNIDQRQSLDGLADSRSTPCSTEQDHVCLRDVEMVDFFVYYRLFDLTIIRSFVALSLPSP